MKEAKEQVFAGQASVAATLRPTLVQTAVREAMEAQLMQLECGFTRGFAGLQLLGSVSDICRDGKERARVALESLGIRIPPQRLVMSLTPADVRMDGNQFDLAVAVTLALLLREGQVQIDPSRWLFAAELGLGGELRPVRGAVSFALAALAGGLEGIVVAPENLAEVSVLVALGQLGDGLKICSYATLTEVLSWLFDEANQRPRTAVSSSRLSATNSPSVTNSAAVAFGLPGKPSPPAADRPAATALPHQPNFDDMILDPELATAALAAAAGMHSLLMRGAPGTGKSMLAARLPSILPNLARDQHIEAMRIYSGCMQKLPLALLAGRPPYRAPHHQASAAAVIGSDEAPGELALAHGGVLFLDELPEFRRDLLEALREPLETGEVHIARSRRKTLWKAGVMLVAACNNCPCGWSGSRRRLCTCPSARLVQYRQRLSGPLIDRIDLHLNMPEPRGGSAAVFLHLEARNMTAQTTRMAAQVAAARAFAAARNAGFGIALNRDLRAHQVISASGLPPAAFGEMVNDLVAAAASTRSLLRCIRVARTLADLRASPTIGYDDLRQAWRWQAEPAARARGDELP